MSRPLGRGFFARPALVVARELLGCRLCFRRPDGRFVSGRIVETEAYAGFEDRASHGWRGRTARNAPMYGPAGHAYVYLIYGMHHCMNVVTDEVDYPAAVLIRALEPERGLAGTDTSGPGRLCRAFGLDRTHSGADLTRPPLTVRPGRRPRIVRATPRIGVDYAGEAARWPWRFVDAESPALSRPIPPRA